MIKSENKSLQHSAFIQQQHKNIKENENSNEAETRILSGNINKLIKKSKMNLDQSRIDEKMRNEFIETALDLKNDQELTNYKYN
jgi:hypothetical protein